MSEPIVHGGGVAAAAAVYGGRADDWLDLSTGINPNPVVLPDIPEGAWHRLPDQDLFDAARIAAQHHYSSGHVLPLPVPGTQAAIQILPRLVPAGLRAAIFSPTYGEYARACMAAGIEVDAIVEPGQIDVRHGLVVVVNPNNPDGRLFDRGMLEQVLVTVRGNGGYLVVDEAFADMEPAASVSSLVDSLPGLIVFRSFGKFFGLAGLRLGFVIAEPKTLAMFQEALGPWAVSGPALSIAAQLMQGETGSIRQGIRARKVALDAVLQGAGLAIVGGTDLFSLVDHAEAGKVHDQLCRSHILVRQFNYNRRWIRFGLLPDAVADARLADVLAGLDR